MIKINQSKIKIKALEKTTGKVYDLFVIDFVNGICKVSNPKDPSDIKSLNLDEIEVKFIKEKKQ